MSVIALALMCAFAPGAIYATVSSPTRGVSVPRLSLNGSLAQDTSLKVKVADQPPPHPGAPAPFVVTIKVNDWTVVADPAVWNEESQTWETNWQIPPGIQGSTVTVTAAFPNGATTSKSFTVQ